MKCFLQDIINSAVNRDERSVCIVNGSPDICGLRFDQITLPGTHNSGSAFNGNLVFRNGELAFPCIFRNQDLNYTAQLEFGIRWFDIDLCLVTEEEETEGIPAGLYTCHSTAYAGPIDEVLRQIDVWMGENYNNVIGIHFNGDYDRSRAEPIATALDLLLDEYWYGQRQRIKRGGPLLMNNDFQRTGQWPLVQTALSNNRRIFVFLHESLQLGDQPWAHNSINSSEPSLTIKDNCDSLIGFTRDECNVCDDLYSIDAIGNRGNCLSATAELCNMVTLNATMECLRLRMEYGKTLNVIEVDYPNRSPEGLSVVDVAKKVNELNVDFFLSGRTDFPNATDCTPGFMPTPSPSPQPRPETYCEALMQIAETPLNYFQCTPNDECNRLICPADLLENGFLFRLEVGIVPNCNTSEDTEFFIELYGPFGGDPLGAVQANKTGLYFLLTFPLIIRIDQMETAIGVEVSCRPSHSLAVVAKAFVGY